MPIIGFETTNSKLSAIYHNDLYLNSSRILKVPSDIKTRSECSQNAPIEQPYTYCQPKTVAYGIAITGNVDINSETYPIQLDVGSWNEVFYSLFIIFLYIFFLLTLSIKYSLIGVLKII